ncbi:hypothetical protein HCN44_000065 [Aphidius gifuensis]|uniref:Uncharacterized protein n=1 Tax=Aphidius gifuensis TaxID=684658 RepID=A0A835CRI8_APHGI|nr:uncharacterized protein LOC122854001 [Aphidius gifuensis]KAF7990260.1 hypothetical protein HCN44_000065 [Aphidius gifuensis]
MYIMDKKIVSFGLLILCIEFVNAGQQFSFRPRVILPSQSLNTTETANDIALRNVLIDLATGNLKNESTVLVDLIKNGISESAMLYPENTIARLRAGAKKAQYLVSDVTAAYTQAIFRAKSSAEARGLLSNFQKIIQMVVDFTKTGKYASK